MDVDAGKLPLIERLEALLDNDKAADVVFVVGDPEKTTPVRIPAISGLLIAASDAFEAMFIGEFLRPSEVSVPDGDPDAFRIMLRYVYTDRLKLGLDCALPVMYLAKKYMLTRLIAESTQLVSTLLSAENVCQILPYVGLVEEISER
ncbi:Btbd6 protein [Aphelenchoides avenae]|nr:Btbd6 protein [Aphelenchus avenae]